MMRPLAICCLMILNGCVAHPVVPTYMPRVYEPALVYTPPPVVVMPSYSSRAQLPIFRTHPYVHTRGMRPGYPRYNYYPPRRY